MWTVAVPAWQRRSDSWPRTQPGDRLSFTYGTRRTGQDMNREGRLRLPRMTGEPLAPPPPARGRSRRRPARRGPDSREGGRHLHRFHDRHLHQPVGRHEGAAGDRPGIRELTPPAPRWGRSSLYGPNYPEACSYGHRPEVLRPHWTFGLSSSWSSPRSRFGPGVTEVAEPTAQQRHGPRQPDFDRRVTPPDQPAPSSLRGLPGRRIGVSCSGSRRASKRALRRRNSM